jgi:preprotein translocase subunit YajC
MLIRPQMKQAKEHKKLLSELKKGDEIMLASGILGKIEKVADNFVILEISDNTQIKVQKNSVQAVLNKGTIKSI